MKWNMNCLINSFLGAAAGSLLVLGSGVNSLPARAESIEPPPGQGAPNGTWGGGSRLGATCQTHPGQPVSMPIALSPSRYVGQTSSPRPTFVVYLPQSTAQNLEFSLFDQDMRGLAQVVVPLPKKSGILELSLPSAVANLTPNQTYYWTVALVCNPGDRTEDVVSRGQIRYSPLSPELQHQVRSASIPEQISAYYKAGFWYEALHLLAQNHQSHPGTVTLQQLWLQLLRAEGIPILGINTLIPLSI